MAGMNHKLLFLFVACAVIGMPILTQPAPQGGLHAEPQRLKMLEREFIETYNRTRDSVAAVLVGNEIFSGFFISEDGLMLTNGDVRDAAVKAPITVHLNSDERRSAELVSADPYNHICLIRVEGRGYAPLDLGYSADVKVGQFVMTVGNVFGSIQNGEDSSFSVGIVSGLYRLTGDIGYRGNVIETDAGVNAGGEGGPMIDSRGKVVGIVAKSYARSRFLGTAVPIDQVRMVLEDMKIKRAIYSGYFGASFENTVITGVEKGSPAEAASLKRGDRITEIDAVLISSDNDIRTVLGNSPAGCASNIGVKRGEEEMIVRVTLGRGVQGKEIKPPVVAARPGEGPVPPAGGGAPWIGLTLVEKGGGRVEVLKVEPGSPAEQAGITPGLRLVSADGTLVGSVAVFDVFFRSVRVSQELILVMENQDGWSREFKVRVGTKVGRDF